MRAGPEDAGIVGFRGGVQLGQLAAEVPADILDRVADAGVDLHVALHQLRLEPVLVLADMVHQVKDGALEGERLGIDQLHFQLNAQGRGIIGGKDNRMVGVGKRGGECGIGHTGREWGLRSGSGGQFVGNLADTAGQ